MLILLKTVTRNDQTFSSPKVSVIMCHNQEELNKRGPNVMHRP